MMSDFDFYVFIILSAVAGCSVSVLMGCIAYFIGRTEWFANLLFGIGDSDNDD